MRLVRTIPFTLALVVALWACFPVRGQLGYDLPADAHLWHLLTCGVTGNNLAAAVYATFAAALFAAPAERALGSRAFAVAAVSSQAVVMPVACVVGAAIERAGFNRWGTDLVNEVYCTPLAWMIGPLAFATARMGVLWRRRLRLVLATLTGTLVLYSGTLSDVVALTAVIAGVAAGEVVWGHTRPTRSASLRESRVLVAAGFVAVSVGPVLTALNPAAQGPFAAESLLMWEPAVDAEDVRKLCGDPTAASCVEAMSINQLHGIAPLLLNVVPEALALVVALGLVRGRRLAWWGAMALSVASLAVVVGQVAGRESDVVSAANSALVVLPWVASIVVLVATRGKFPVASDWRRVVRPLAVALTATAAAWVAGSLLLADGFVGEANLRNTLFELPLRYLPPAVAVELPHRMFPHTAGAWVLYEWVGVVFWCAALWALFRVLSSAPSPAAEADRARARDILVHGTGDHLAWMGLWEGNRYFFAGDAGYVAYRVSHNVAVTVGSPVVSGSNQAEVAGEFEQFAASQGWRVAWYSVPEDFARPGFNTVHVAEESVLYTDNLEFKGKKFQNIRTARNRAGKEGVRAVWTTWAECSLEMREKIAALSEQWVADKALPEMGFTLGSLEELRDPDTKLLLAVDDSGHLHGVTSWLPVYEHRAVAGYTLDFMRRDADGFRPVIEFLLAEAAVVAGSEGLGWVSLSGAPLARTDEPSAFLDILLDKTGATIEPLYGFRSLAASKHKFHPTHTSWNLAYDDELALASIGLAVVSCYLPDMKTADVAAVVREFLKRRDRGLDRAEVASPGGGTTPRP